MFKKHSQTLFLWPSIVTISNATEVSGGEKKNLGSGASGSLAPVSNLKVPTGHGIAVFVVEPPGQ